MIIKTYDAIIIGSGAAGYSAADRLFSFGVKNIALITEDRLAGTSRNTGSDKQTYYKLTLAGDEPDSVLQMAQTLFEGHAVDGDTALCEAALSTRCFLHLAELGVPFPTNAYGEYVGYKTDHDPARRATSAGPLTSKYMTERLEEHVRSLEIDFYDQCPIVRLLAVDGQMEGALAYSFEQEEYILFAARYVVYATGGPAGLYAKSVYPGSQHGATGLALEAGAVGKNLTEWQYGLASIGFRWNLSGTYQQVLPRYLSTAQDGSDEKEFLRESLSDEEILSKTFLKGYQWPFDPRKITGSSQIDLLVYQETELKGRLVYLDFTQNPTGLKEDFSNIGDEARDYLSHSEALFGTPIERLLHMNPKAAELYASHGIDLAKNRLEIAVCAQHNNGGLDGDDHWESPVQGLYPVGEVNGSHGVYRPGGSALNAGQVGAFRAAEKIAKSLRPEAPPLSAEAIALAEERIAQMEGLAIGESEGAAVRKKIGQRMSVDCGVVREMETLQRVADAAKKELAVFWETTHISKENPARDRVIAVQNYDLLLAQAVYAEAMAEAVRSGIFSRGSYVVVDGVEGTVLPDDGSHDEFVQLARFETLRNEEGGFAGGEIEISYRPVRPIPQSEQWFEKIYNESR